MNLSLLNSKAWKCEAFEPQPVLETIWPIVSKLDLKPLTNWQGVDLTDLQETREPLIEGCLFFFYTDKIEKLSVGFLVLMKRVAATTMIITPNDDYDFPTFSAEFIENPASVNFLMDMHPLRDLAIDPWYREKYLDPIEPIWKQYQDVQNEIVQLPWYRSILSPYSISGRHKVETPDRSGLSRITECFAKYLEYYVDHVIPNAEPIKDPQAKEFPIRKKRAMGEFAKTYDPGTAVLVKLLGVEKAQKRLHAIF